MECVEFRAAHANRNVHLFYVFTLRRWACQNTVTSRHISPSLPPHARVLTATALNTDRGAYTHTRGTMASTTTELSELGAAWLRLLQKGLQADGWGQIVEAVDSYDKCVRVCSAWRGGVGVWGGVGWRGGVLECMRRWVVLSCGHGPRCGLACGGGGGGCVWGGRGRSHCHTHPEPDPCVRVCVCVRVIAGCPTTLLPTSTR